jgi:GNAT superfamily N-acetyltransferase
MTFVNRSLARQLEMCHARRGIEYARAKAQLRPECGVKIETACGGQAIFAGINSPLNRVIGMGFERPVNMEDLECIEAFFATKNVTPRIDICPLTDKTLLEALRQNHYEIEAFQNILICPLSDEPHNQIPKNMEVRQASPEEAGVWILTTAQGFEETEVPSQETLDILAPNFHARNGICFLAWINGEPAGGGGMYLHEEIVEFGGASTRLGFRRRGVQTALLFARKAAARSQGCNLAMVLSEPGSNSQRNLEKLGFHLAYTKVLMVKSSRA